MYFRQQTILLEAIDRAKRGRRKQLTEQLQVHAARLLRQRKRLPPELADFIAELLDPQTKKSTRGLKGDRLRSRDNKICRAVMDGANLNDIADEYGLSYDRVRAIVRERSPHLEALDALQQLGEDIMKTNVLSPRRR